MRRTVKAWVLRDGHGDAVTVRIERDNIVPCCKGEKAVPCVVTYDDGRPAPRKRTKGGRRG